LYAFVAFALAMWWVGPPLWTATEPPATQWPVYELVDIDEATSDPKDLVVYQKYKISESYFREWGDTIRGGGPVAASAAVARPAKSTSARDHRRQSQVITRILKRGGGDARTPAKYMGDKQHNLAPMNQNYCGSCWAVASAQAMKANLRFGTSLTRHELPVLEYLVSCSTSMYQILNHRNAAEKAIMAFEADRPQTAGCGGGLTGIALAMVQMLHSFQVDDTRQYRAGTIGDVGPHRSVSQQTCINRPCRRCGGCGDKHAGGSSDKCGWLARPDIVDRNATRDGALRALDPSRTDMFHLFRAGSSYHVHFPYTADVRRALTLFGALVVYVDMESGFNQAELMHNDKTIDFPTCKWSYADFQQSGVADGHALSAFAKADHAVTLVGYDCERSAWLVMNSWGEEWADRGRVWLRDANVCKDGVMSAESYGAGPGCMFASSVSAFTHEDIDYET